MTIMKKMMALIIAGFIAMAHISCIATVQPLEREPVNEAFSSESDEAGEVVPESESNLIAYCGLIDVSFFFEVVKEGIRQSALEEGYEFVWSNANQNFLAQKKQYEAFIEMSPKAILIDTVDSEGIADLLKQAKQAGIATAAVDTPVTNGSVDISVRLDDQQAGALCAQTIVEKLIEKYGEPRGTVVNIYGRQNSEGCRLRKQGFDQVMANYPKIECIYAYGTTPKEAMESMGEVISQPDIKIDAINAYSDSMMTKVVELLKEQELWKTGQEKGHIIIVTIDGDYMALEYIREGYYDATVGQDAAAFGEIAMEMLENYIFQGKEIPLGEYVNERYVWETCNIVDSASGPMVLIPGYLITKDTVEDERYWVNRAINEWNLLYRAEKYENNNR